MRANYVESVVQEKDELVTDLLEGSNLLFNSITESLSNKHGKEVKAFRTSDNKMIYLLQKHDNNITIYTDRIGNYQKEDSTENLLKYTIAHLKDRKAKDNEIYHSVLFSGVLSKNKKPTPKELKLKTSKFESVLKELKNLYASSNESLPPELKEMEENMKKGSNYLFNMEKKQIKSTSNIGELRNYLQLLKTEGHITSSYDEPFLLGLNKQTNQAVDKNLFTYTNDMLFLLKTCQEKKFNSYKKAFEFNDLDNHVWIKNDKLVVTDQNCGFYFNIIDNQNFTVYFLEKEYQDTEKEIKRIENAIKTKAIDNLTDMVLKVEDGKTVLSHNQLMHILELDLEFSTKAVEEDGLAERTYPVDIYSYEYQKNYYYTEYGMSEFEFLAHTFLILSDNGYNKKTGTFKNDPKYIKELEIEDNSLENKVTDFSYCYPKTISYLNEEWLAGLKSLVYILKRDKPKPVAYDGKTPKEAVEKAIAYFEEKIEKLDKQQLKKNKL